MVADMSRLGFRRLPRAALERWNNVRIALSEADAPVCAGFWTGGVPPADITAAVSRREPEHVRAWMAVVVQAAATMLDAAPASAPATLDDGIAGVLQHLGPGARARFRHALFQGAEASQEEACWAMLTLMRGARELDPVRREGLLRALASS